MVLSDLISCLEKVDQDTVIPFGFNNPHSYRGSYQHLAFEPANDVSVGEMLDGAKRAVGAEYEGWKGGEYVMDEDTEVYLSFEGRTGVEISFILLGYMVGGRPDFFKPVEYGWLK